MTHVTPAEVRRESARSTDGRFGAQPRNPAEVGFDGVRARDVNVWLGDAQRFTLDGIMHSARGGNDRFLVTQFEATATNLQQMKGLCSRGGMQGIMVWDRARGRRGARYAADTPLDVAVFHGGRAFKLRVTPARLVQATHAWFYSGKDEPILTPDTCADTPTTQAEYAAMRPFTNRYRDDLSNPGGMQDFASWWREPRVSDRGLGFMDGDALVVTETGFDLLETKGGHGPLEARMKTGQIRTLEAWGKVPGCRAFAIDEGGTVGSTAVVEYTADGVYAYDTSLYELRDTLCGGRA